jgi:hypothetical protein
MRAEGIVEILIDDGEKKLILSSEDKIKIQARKKKKGQGDD